MRWTRLTFRGSIYSSPSPSVKEEVFHGHVDQLRGLVPVFRLFGRCSLACKKIALPSLIDQATRSNLARWVNTTRKRVKGVWTSSTSLPKSRGTEPVQPCQSPFSSLNTTLTTQQAHPFESQVRPLEQVKMCDRSLCSPRWMAASRGKVHAQGLSDRRCRPSPDQTFAACHDFRLRYHHPSVSQHPPLASS